jgi:hypothetical protein
MGGARFFRPMGRVVPFGQMLTGVAYLRGTPPNGARFALQPGVGVTVYLTDRVGVRLSGDYRTLVEFDDGAYYTHEARLISGFTLQWGAR